MANGCKTYAKATVDIYFADARICCDLCPLMETYSRKQCRRTGEYLADTRGVGLWCPLNVQEEKTDG